MFLNIISMKQKKFYLLSSLIISSYILLLSSCAGEKEKTTVRMDEKNLIPLPASIAPAKSAFEIKDGTVIYIPGNSEALLSVGRYLADFLKPATGFSIPVKVSEKSPPSGNIYLTLNGTKGDLGNEGYEMKITKKMIRISAVQPAGLFYGIQTLRQLLPYEIELKTVQSVSWVIPAGSITDKPVYTFRGAMLDVARHFFKPEDVKAYLDMLAAFKLNVLHLHLSDDQGWRIEIKSWPKLTETGGSTQVGGGEGGFYTQEEYRDLVNYAAERYITIIPEIDMPGHTNAALASYGELNCDGARRKLYTGTEVGFSTLCTDKEIVYKFIDDVVGEISAMSPGPWFHIGGDESHVTPMEDYIPFVNRVQEIVKKHGKKVIGWDEIANAKLVDHTTVQFWARTDNTLKGIEQGAKVIMSPAKRTYLDMQYDSTTRLGLHWVGYVEVDSAYMWDPATLVPGIIREDVLGVESPLWTETITTLKDLEYMVFPRLIGHAEIGWTPADKRKWDKYKVRLGNFAPRLKAMKIDFYRSPLVPWKD